MLAVNSWLKLQKLSRSELTLLLKALLLLPLTAFCIQLFGFRRLYAAIAKQNSKYNLVPNKINPNLTARLVRLASYRGIYRPNCLQQSVVLWWLLRSQGIESDIRIGVRKQERQLEAHAWVEYQGYVLNDSSDVSQRFVPFAGPIEPMGAKIP